MPGTFIAVEGGEGAGKTSQLAIMREYLERAGRRVMLTREPGGTALGEDIRALLLGHRHEGMTSATETYAYQGGGRGVSLDKIAALESWVQEGLRPDLILLFDLPVEIGLARAGRRGASDRFEREERAFFERVRTVYLDRARQEPDRYRIVDADRPIAAVKADVEAILADWLERGDG